MMMALFVIGLLAMSISGIWFIIVAFRQHVGWGFAVIFIPFASLVFLIKYWQAARASFLVQLISTVLVFAGIAGMGGMEVLRHDSGRLLTASPRPQTPVVAEFDDTVPTNPGPNSGSNPGSTSDTPTPATATQHPSPLAADPRAKTPQPALVAVRIADARKYVGEKLRITTHTHLVREATLKQVQGTTLIFERRLYRGSVSFEMHPRDIDKLERWTPQP